MRLRWLAGVRPGAPAAARGAGGDGFLAVTAVVFAAAVLATVRLCGPRAGAMRMPGGGSSAWLRMPGQGWLGAWAAFTGAWTVMMVAMMLPTLAPALRRYRRAATGDDGRAADVRTLLAGAGYFAVWAGLGAAVYPPGALVSAAAPRWGPLATLLRAAAGAVLLLAGAVQLTRWKASQLARWRDDMESEAESARPGAFDCCALPPEPTDPRLQASMWRAALRDGVRLGARCALCCGGLMAALLALGVMDLRAMAALAGAIAAERVLPWPLWIARASGAALLLLGLLALARSLGAA